MCRSAGQCGGNFTAYLSVLGLSFARLGILQQLADDNLITLRQLTTKRNPLCLLMTAMCCYLTYTYHYDLTLNLLCKLVDVVVFDDVMLCRHKCQLLKLKYSLVFS